jgi:SPP1 family predicted phage head-tail adaptor
MRAGDLRHHFLIQEQLASQDSYGQAVSPWTNFAWAWGSIEPINGREFFAVQQVRSEVDTKVRMRFLAGVQSTMRIVLGSKIFDIQSVIDVEYRHVELQLMCKELT